MRLPCRTNLQTGILFCGLVAAVAFTCFAASNQAEERRPRAGHEKLYLLAADGGNIMFTTTQFRLPDIHGMTLKELVDSELLESILFHGLRVQLENGQATNPVPANNHRVVRVSKSPFSRGDVIVIEIDCDRLLRN